MGKRTLELQTLYRQLLAQPFDFTTPEAWETDPAKATYPATPAEQREQWRKMLKYQTLARLSELLDDEAKKNRQAPGRHQGGRQRRPPPPPPPAPPPSSKPRPASAC